MIHRVLVGGTASGKKQVAAALFRRHGLRPLSMDSMKVYRGMDVGTAKPSAALRAETGFGLLDLVGHDEPFSAGRWIEAARDAVARESGPVLFAGGTPLYLRLLLRGLFPGPPADPALRAELDALWEAQGEAGLRAELRAADPELEARLLPGDRKRLVRGVEVHRLTGRPLSRWQRDETERPIDAGFLVVALRHDARRHAGRIAARVERMLDEGLLEEVAALAARAPFAPEPGRSIGYLEALEHLAGRLERRALVERVTLRTVQLARKQRIFLASFPEIRWVDVPVDADVEHLLPAVEAGLGL
ncbi:MAG: tRNA (adenosine(37)-N6)-dimethylallyltransferase MiaA [Planctomycetes bacterium]|nr:tRNA (adenosine(37)-N6)-dimethylallyltransferase MiaA [Planctomycetota bacterium]